MRVFVVTILPPADASKMLDEWKNNVHLDETLHGVHCLFGPLCPNTKHLAHYGQIQQTTNS